FVFLLLPLQVLATAALPRLGYKRQMVSAWLARAVFLLVPLGLAAAAPEPPAAWMASLLVASVFAFCLFRAVGTAAHIPWLAAILPIEARGRFFATDQTVTALVGVGTLLVCASLLGAGDRWEAFRNVYGIAIAGGLAAVVCLTRLPGATPPKSAPLRELPREAGRLLGTPGLFRFYLALALLSAFVPAGMAAFTAYYLKVEAGVASGRILALTAAHYAGAMLGGWAIRRLIDRVALRRLFRTAQAIQIVVFAYWLAILLGAEELGDALPLAFLVFGAGVAISNSAHFTFLPSLASDDERPLMVAVFTAVFGLLAGLSPVVWGLALKDGGSTPRMDVDAFVAYFAVGIVLALLLIPLFGRLPELRDLERARRPVSSPGPTPSKQ
ncbi:MAG: MFS transporter, partial [Myxococcota bacterium]|nr:MFS transporter [Myxococcota bacterium]